MRYEVRCLIPGALITQRAPTLERARKLRDDLRKKEKVIKSMRLVRVVTAAELREERLRLRAALVEAKRILDEDSFGVMQGSPFEKVQTIVDAALARRSKDPA